MILTPTFRDMPRKALGMVVLSAEETLERAARATIPADTDLFVTRVPSGKQVTSDSLAAMEHDLPTAAALFPAGRRLDAVAYACTSGTAQIGAPRIADILTKATGCTRITDPLTALIAACRAQNITRVAFLSPYTEDVSATIRAHLWDAGIATPAIASFDIPTESQVARITPDAIIRGATRLEAQGPVDAVFLSCTNLDTDAARPAVARSTGLPCLCSNSVLLSHLMLLSNALPPGDPSVA